MIEHKVEEPIKDVWLIFDEIVVTAGIVWNSTSGSIIGYQMGSNEMTELQDIYSEQVDDEAKETDHILLFLARSATYSFQMVGPHFTNAGPFKADYVKACFTETVLTFYQSGFIPTLAICDGASTNLSCLKSMMDVQTFRRFENDGKEKDISPISHNFGGVIGLHIHFIICPSHELKNMINALESSSGDGTKKFMFDELLTIEWSHIYSAFYRELE
eukprot:Pompholyxophrys_punicea_v1_NODE_163_length_3053_cov_6.121081.p2 type:complete len:216 gc:universal NODE_163_length_3053_cov_6.121081:1775-1128(-)